MKRLLLVGLPVLALSGCGQDVRVTQSGGTFGPGPATKVARIETAEEFQLRPPRLGAPIGFTTSVDVEHAAGRTVTGLDFDLPCVDVGVRPRAGSSTRLGDDRTTVELEVRGTYRRTSADRPEAEGGAACVGSDTSYVARTATLRLRHDDETERHDVDLRYPVVLFPPAR